MQQSPSQTQPQKEAKDYKERAQQRKEQKVNDLWQEITTNTELKNFVKLRSRLGQSHKQRENTSGMIQSMKMDYNQLKGDIKEFMKKQNKIKTVSTAVTNKKPH